MKFTLTSEQFAATKTTVEFHADDLQSVLENVKLFLQGSGFVLDTTENIEVVDNSWQFDNDTEMQDDYSTCSFELAEGLVPDIQFDINSYPEYIMPTETEKVKRKKGKK